MYQRFLQLRKLHKQQRSQEESAQHVTTQIRAIKLAPPTAASSTNLNLKKKNRNRVYDPLLDEALLEAKRMTKKHGITASEAKLAWETVEQIASADMSEAMKGGITDDECLVEMIEACEAMDELNRALFLNENRDASRYQGWASYFLDDW